jgi:hypothetical protein
MGFYLTYDASGTEVSNNPLIETIYNPYYQIFQFRHI